MTSRLVFTLHACAPMRALTLFVAVTAVSCRQPTVYENVDAETGMHHGDALGAHDVTLDDVAHDAASVTDAPPTCAPANIIHGDGHHNPGQDCMGSCHDHGFSLAGTLYLADNVTPANNATISIVDANGGKQDIIVSTNGNFFSYLPAAFPIHVESSLCPSTQFMVSTATTGGCNTAACHGGAQGVAHL